MLGPLRDGGISAAVLWFWCLSLCCEEVDALAWLLLLPQNASSSRALPTSAGTSHPEQDMGNPSAFIHVPRQELLLRWTLLQELNFTDPQNKQVPGLCLELGGRSRQEALPGAQAGLAQWYQTGPLIKGT